MRIGCIDIGTNSVRYLAAESGSSGSPKIIARGLKTPRLGEGLTGTGMLSEKAIDRTIRDLTRIKNELTSQGVSEFRCVGTEALRLADNGDTFIRRAGEIGLKITILTGEEEARLIYAGALDSLKLSTGNNILVDIGGGSTEIIIPREGKAPHFVSLPLGCVRLKELFSPLNHNRMRKYCRKKLGLDLALWVNAEKTRPDQGLTHNARSDPDFMVGLGGTFTTLAAIHLGLREYDGDQIHGLVLTGKEIEGITKMLNRGDPKKLKKVPGLEPSRADIIIPGIIIVQAVMEHFGFNRVIISDRGLLRGMIPRYSGSSFIK